MTFEEQVILLIAENKALKGIIRKLELRLAELEEELRKARISKDSSNSGKPPSSDISTSGHNRSLREKGVRNSGGQTGHKGTTLLLTDSPDEIVELKPDYCNGCGCNLEKEEPHFESRRQVIEIPPVKPVVTECQNYRKLCPKCGHKQLSDYPLGVNNHVQYGSNIEAAIAYFSVYQYMPFKRLKECMKHIFGL